MRKRPNIKIIIEKHKDGYVAYPIGLKGIVVGQGNSYDEALTDVRSAIRFHIETFGPNAIERDESVLEVFTAEADVSFGRASKVGQRRNTGGFDRTRGMYLR